MAETFLPLSKEDRADALGVATEKSGRPTHLLEKDIWVVWALRAMFGECQGSCRLRRYVNAATWSSFLRPARGRLSETSASARHLRMPRDQRAGRARRASS